jgi:predicted SAM-dependent methyltransferase
MELKINVGCGSTPTPGYLNLDNSFTLVLSRVPFLPETLRRMGLITADQLQFARVARREGIRWANVARRIPLGDETASVVYASHVLEHLDRSRARSFLAEARRVLIPGGVLRLAVPDLDRLARRYLETGDADAFVASTLLTEDRPRSRRHALHLLLFGARAHGWMYDSASLSRLLLAAGFEDRASVPPGATTIADPGDLDLRERAEESVYVEARKPLRG